MDPTALGTYTPPSNAASSTPTATPGVLNINNLPAGYSIPTGDPGASAPQAAPSLNINNLPLGYSIANGAPAAAPSQPSSVSKGVADVKALGTNLKNDTEGHAANIVEDLSQKPSMTGALDVAGNVAGEVGDFFGEPLKSAASAALGPEAKQGIKSAVSAIAGTPEAKAVVDAWNKLQAQHPDAAKNIGNVVNIGMLFGGDVGGEAAGVPTAEDAAQAAKEGVANAKDAVTDLPEKVQTAFEERYQKQAADEWAQQTAGTKAGKKALAKAAMDNKDPIGFLSERGISPSGLASNGKIDATEAASNIVKQAQPLEETYQKLLATADQGNAPVPMDKIRDAALAAAAKTPNATAGQLEDMKASIDSEVDALQRKYGDDMTRVQMNQEKRNYWANTKFNPTDPVASAKNTVNYSIGTGLKSSIEDNTPNTMVKEMNQEMAKHYSAAKFLQDFDTKPIKKTLGQKIVGAAIKTAGSAVGESIGGFGGGVGGYLTANYLTKALEGMSNPLKSFILKNLDTEDPQILKTVQAYLDQNASEQSTRLALPAPTNETPIVTPNTKGTPGPNYNPPTGPLGHY